MVRMGGAFKQILNSKPGLKKKIKIQIPEPPHGHRKWPQRRCIRLLPPPFLLGVIVAKDHVMVH